MTIGYQRAQQQIPRIEDMTKAEAHAEWQANKESYRPDLPQDEMIYRCYVQDMLHNRSHGESIT